MSNRPGKLIVMYGINNLGKSTQAKLLVQKMNEHGFATEYLKYPIYDLLPSGEILNDYLRKGNFYNLNAKEAQIIYALNRTQYQTELIAKLEAGTNIVAEDYKGTGIAWGLGAGVSEMFLKSINSHLIEEDLVFLFDGERFISGIEKDHRHENNNDLMNKVRWAHLKLKEEYGWTKINANSSIETIQELIWNKTLAFLENKETGRESEKPKTTYGYSSFKAVGEIISNNHQTIINSVASQETIAEPEEIKTEAKAEIKPEAKPEIELETKSKIETETTEKTSTKLAVEKVSPSAKLPEKAHQGDAGFDLYADEYYSISPYHQETVNTGIKLAIPSGFVGLIWDKSGLAASGITTMGGVIDSSYRGEIKVVIKNLSEDIFHIIPGQKIAQIIIQAAPDFKLNEQKLDNESDRGTNGFGSSGQF